MTKYSKRFLTVGSLLRTEELSKFNREIEKREDITYPFYDDLEGYRETEEKAVEEIIKKQIDHGLSQITDGEYSRSMWHLDFLWGLEGVERYIRDHGYSFQCCTDKHSNEEFFETRKDIGLRIVGKLKCKNHQFIDHFKRSLSFADDSVELKLTIPAPAQVYSDFTRQLLDEDGNYYNEIYKTVEELKDGLANVYGEFFDEYVEAGGKIIQLDDCTWTVFSKDNPGGIYHMNPNVTDDEVKAVTKEYVDLNNRVIALAKDRGLKVYTHNCRGNYSSRNFTSGTYEAVANYFLANQDYDRFYLEWDDERAGSISALESFKDKPETEVVLGLLSSKTSGLDDEDRVLKALEEATKYVAKDKLYLSHQCGFASCDEGNELNEDQEWAKIDQGHKIALEFFGE